MSSKHTAGPWCVKTYERQGCAIICDGKGDELASIDLACMPDAEADARLIAAAPDLLAACEAVAATTWSRNTAEKIGAQVRAAIKKARGDV